MENETVANYGLFWGIYLAASAVFFVVFWRLTAFRRHVWLSYLLRSLLLALALTPWYANPEGTVMAPALMVVTLDAITLGASASVRALVPLLLGILLALLVGAIVYFINKGKRRLNSIE